LKPPDSNFRDRAQQITALVDGVQQLPDPRARSQVQAIVKQLLDLHGTALELILDRLASIGPSGLELIDSLAQDELVGSLMLLYGLHPQDLESRVRQALDKVRPLLRSHAGNVELLGITDGTVRLRLLGSCHGCPSSAMTLKLAIEEAILNAAPDVTSLEVDGVAEPHAPEPAMLVPLELLQMPGVRGDGGSTRVLSSGANRASVTEQPLPLLGGEGP
jgi:Fe-S cluster biogenesis protein NfuA